MLIGYFVLVLGGTKETRSKTKVSLKIRIFREQRQIRKHLSMIDKRSVLLTKKVNRLNRFPVIKFNTINH